MPPFRTSTYALHHIAFLTILWLLLPPASAQTPPPSSSDSARRGLHVPETPELVGSRFDGQNTLESVRWTRLTWNHERGAYDVARSSSRNSGSTAIQGIAQAIQPTSLAKNSAVTLQGSPLSDLIGIQQGPALQFGSEPRRAYQVRLEHEATDRRLFGVTLATRIETGTQDLPRIVTELIQIEAVPAGSEHGAPDLIVGAAIFSRHVPDPGRDTASMLESQRSVPTAEKVDSTSNKGAEAFRFQTASFASASASDEGCTPGNAPITGGLPLTVPAGEVEVPWCSVYDESGNCTDGGTYCRISTGGLQTFPADTTYSPYMITAYYVNGSLWQPGMELDPCDPVEEVTFEAQNQWLTYSFTSTEFWKTWPDDGSCSVYWMTLSCFMQYTGVTKYRVLNRQETLACNVGLSPGQLCPYPYIAPIADITLAADQVSVPQLFESYGTAGDGFTYAWSVKKKLVGQDWQSVPIPAGLADDPSFYLELTAGHYEATLRVSAGNCDPETSITFNVRSEEEPEEDMVLLSTNSTSNPPGPKDACPFCHRYHDYNLAGTATAPAPFDSNDSQKARGVDGVGCSMPASGFKGDPVHIQSGNFFDQRLDLTQATVAGTLSWERSYWSNRSDAGELGRGWRHGFERRLSILPSGDAVETDERGNQIQFPSQGNGNFGSANNLDIRIVLEDNGDRAVLYATGRRYIYRPDGRLRSVRDIRANSLHLSYDENGVLSSILDDRGRGLTFSTQAGRITAAQSNGGFRVEYSYDLEGRLSEVRDARGKLYTYAYNGDGNLASSTLPTGIQTNIAYDGEKRVAVTSERDPSGFTSLSNYVYPSPTTRLIINPTGGMTTYEFDAQQNEVRRTLPDLRTYVYERDSAGRLLSLTHPGNRVERWSYSNGELISHTDLEGKTTLAERDPGTDDPIGTTYPDGSLDTTAFDSFGNISEFKDEAGRESTFTYSATGKLTSATGPGGGTTRFEYDADDNLVKIIDALSRGTTIDRNSLGEETSRTSPGNKTTRLEYEGQTLVKAIVNPLSQRTTFERDDLARVIATILPNGGRIEQEYLWANGQSHVTSVRSPVGGVSRTEYNPAGHATAVIDELGRRTTFIRDPLGRVLRTEHPDGTFHQNFFDALGHLAATRDSIGRETSYHYDARDRLIRIRTPDGLSHRVEYDDRGRPVRKIAPDGATSEIQYNAVGEPIASMDALGRRTQFNYGSDGNLDSIIDALGKETRFEQDLLDRVTKTISDLGFESRQEYDVDGNLNLRVDAKGGTVQIIFDALNRPIEVKNPLGHSVKTAYDSVGNVTRIEDENGHAWLMEYDLAGRKTKVTDPNGRSVLFEYDLANQLTKKTLADGATIEFSHDVMGRLTSRTYKKPDGTIEDTHVFTYDVVGRRVTAENASVKVVSTWDIMDRETARSVTFKTDPRAPLVRKLSFTYDAVGRRKSMDDHAGRVARYTYDLAGQLARLDLESRQKNGRLRTRTYRFTYDAVGNLLETLFPNNVRTRRTYDSDHRLTQILHETVTVASNPDGTVTATPVATLQTLDYQLDPLGNILRIDELEGKGWRYAYDAASRLVEAHMSEPLFQALSAKDDRLTAAEKAALAEDGAEPEPPANPDEEPEPPPCRRVTYTYDPAGNRLSENRDGLIVTSTFGLANELLTAGRLRYAYDLRGNLVEKIFPAGNKQLYTYNVADQMTAFSRYTPAKPRQNLPEVTTLLESYFYSPFGERTGIFKRNLTDATKDRLTHFLWDRGRPVEEFWQPADQTLPMTGKRYLWALGQLLEQGATKFEGVVPTGAPSFELASSYFQGDASRYAQVDHLGSVRMLTTPAGALAQKTTWGPWGELLEGGTGSRFGYTGHQRDAASGMHYSVFRYLDPRNGRWSQRDPIGFAGGQSNLYGYVRNAPTRLVDPRGLANIYQNPDGSYTYDEPTFDDGLFGGTTNVDPGDPSLLEIAIPLGITGGIAAAPIAPEVAAAGYGWAFTHPLEAAMAAEFVGGLAGVPCGAPTVGQSLSSAAKITLKSRIKDSTYAIKMAESLSEAAQTDVNALTKALMAGNTNPGIGTRALGKGFYELRGRNAGRVIVKQTSTNAFDIVGKFQGHKKGDDANSKIIETLMKIYEENQ